jgi:uncharacterized protein YbaP (TraB family)
MWWNGIIFFTLGGLWLCAAHKCPPSKSKVSSYLWVMKPKHGKESIIFGTQHISVQMLSTEGLMKIALELAQADSVITETASTNLIPSMDKPSTELPEEAKCMFLQPLGRGLDEVFPKELFRRLLNFALQNNHQEYLLLEPKCLLFRLLEEMVLEDIDSEQSGIILDRMLEELARDKYKKEIRAAETFCDHFSQISRPKKDLEFLIDYILAFIEWKDGMKKKGKYPKRMPDPNAENIQRYLCGTFDASCTHKANTMFSDYMLRNFTMDKASDERMKKVMLAVMQDDLSQRRNKKMVENIHKMIEKEPHKKFFIALGIAHYFGDGNVLELFRKKGYTVEALPPLPAQTKKGKEEL